MNQRGGSLLARCFDAMVNGRAQPPNTASASPCDWTKNSEPGATPTHGLYLPAGDLLWPANPTAQLGGGQLNQ